jgi:hypothetical protein
MLTLPQPTAAEHLLEVLAATELAVAELWASESSRAPSPELPPPMPVLVPRLPTPPPPMVMLVRASMSPIGRPAAPGPPPAFAPPAAREDDHAVSLSPADGDANSLDAGSDDSGEYLSTASSDAEQEYVDASDVPSCALATPNAPSPPAFEPEPEPNTVEATHAFVIHRTVAAGGEPDASSPRAGPLPEPPFMTDGRGRVVWSRTGAKDGATEAHASGVSA